MTTKITLDPAIVSDVLEIEKQLKELECDCRLNITIYNDFICIEGCDHISDTGFYLDDKEIVGMMLNDDGDYCIDIHRFKDLAIKKCAGWGYMIDRGHVDGDIWQITVWDDKESLTIYKEEVSLIDMFSTELAAISFVWEQIQKEKKDEKSFN